MRKKTMKDSEWSTAKMSNFMAYIVMCLGVLYAAYQLKHWGYRAGQIDWQKGKKCVVLQTTEAGEKIYIDTCQFLK